MPLILYGGTFDPVHEGHVAIARRVAAEFDAPVHLLPSADPPHRAAPGASAAQRALMLDLACAGDPWLRVDRRELHREGPSYTVDTLHEVRKDAGPRTPIIWVLGIDSLVQLDSWRNWRHIFDLSHVLGVERPGTGTGLAWLAQAAPEVFAEVAARHRPAGALCGEPSGLYGALPMDPLRTESSTEVRRRIQAGLPWEGLVPAAVAKHIDDAGLYGAAPRR